MSSVISKLMVSLGLDNSKFNSGLKKSEKQTSSFGKSINKVGGMIAGAFALAKITAFFKSSFKLYGEQIKVEKSLRAQIEANGKSADSTLADYKRFASGLQSITTVGDETTLRLIQVAESMGASTAQSKLAASGAIGLSKAFGISLETAMRGVILANNGQYEMLQRYIPTLRTANTDTEKSAALNKAMGDGMKIAMSEVDSGVGKVQQLSNAWGDLQEQLGGAIAENSIFTDMIKAASHVIWQLSTTAKDVKLEAIFGAIDIDGKTAEDRIESINAHLKSQTIVRQQLIDKESKYANLASKTFKDEQGRFDTKLVEKWAVARLSSNQEYNDSLSITKTLTEELNKVDIGGDPKDVISVSDEIKILNEELKLAQRNATQTEDVDLFRQGIKDVDTLTKKIEMLKGRLSEISLNKDVSMPTKFDAIDSPKINLPKDEQPTLPLKLTTEGTFGESAGFIAFQKQQQAALLETQNAIDQTAMATQTYGTIMGSVGTIAGAMGDSTIATFANVASQVISSVAQMIPALFGQSIAGAVASGAALPFPANLAAIAAGVAGVVSAFSGIGGGSASAGASTTSIDTRGYTSPTTNEGTRRTTSTTSQSINVEVTGIIKGKDIALANNQGQKQLKR